jgi:hypothetical protein
MECDVIGPVGVGLVVQARRPWRKKFSKSTSVATEDAFLSYPNVHHVNL